MGICLAIKGIGDFYKAFTFIYLQCPQEQKVSSLYVSAH